MQSIDTPSAELLRRIPNVDRLLSDPSIAACGARRREAADAVREILADLRESILSGEAAAVPADCDLVRSALELAERRARRGLRRVVNGTGVIIHSNLGRACVSKAAAAAAMEAASAYSSLEFDLDSGKRGSRTGFIEELLCGITGAEGALVVNNNASSVLLILSAIARGGNVVVSRGELVEIGGGFRIPDILAQCGCELREVGTTNKTRPSDYANAIDGETRALLKVHCSNFKIVGFTQSVPVKELAAIGRERGIPVIDDIGSGALADLRKYGIYDEPSAPDSLRDGADVVSFSGDKLLGGPQCGIVAGREPLVSSMKKHPLYRAFRTGKMVNAALEATLRAYADPLAAEREIPVITMLALPEDVLLSRAESLCAEIAGRGGSAEAVPTKSTAGGGSAPGLSLDSYAVMPSGPLTAENAERALRSLPTPVIGYIEKDRLLLDVRTMSEEDFAYVAEAVAGLTRK